MRNRLTRRRRLSLMVFIMIVFTSVWLLQLRPATAQALDTSAHHAGVGARVARVG
jgi:hypothetical protein